MKAYVIEAPGGPEALLLREIPRPASRDGWVLIRVRAFLVEKIGKPLVFVLNGATQRARITAEAISVISYYGPLAPVIIHQRVDFAASMIDGRTVMEVSGAKPAAQEIVQLWQFLANRLNIGQAPPAPVPEARVGLGA